MIDMRAIESDIMCGCRTMQEWRTRFGAETCVNETVSQLGNKMQSPSIDERCDAIIGASRQWPNDSGLARAVFYLATQDSELRVRITGLSVLPMFTHHAFNQEEYTIVQKVLRRLLIHCGDERASALATMIASREAETEKVLHKSAEVRESIRRIIDPVR